jgi:uncharacterized membrane protein YcaP (DUF421 family)
MALGFTLIAIAIAGLIYGIVKKNRKMIVASVITLIVIAALYALYSYLYSKNPY